MPEKTRTKIEAQRDLRLGRELAIARHAASMTLEQVAAATGLKPEVLHDYESGERAAPFGRLVSILEAIGADPVALIDRTLEDRWAASQQAGAAVAFAHAASQISKPRQKLLMCLLREMKS